MIIKSNEKHFKEIYANCVMNFNQELFEYCDLLIDTMKNTNIKTLKSKDEFNQFAIEAMLWKAKRLASDYEGKYKALHEAKNIINVID